MGIAGEVCMNRRENMTTTDKELEDAVEASLAAKYDPSKPLPPGPELDAAHAAAQSQGGRPWMPGSARPVAPKPDAPPQAQPPQTLPDYDAAIADILSYVHDEVLSARQKFPLNENLTIALMEEAGELAKATLCESPESVKKEAIQVAAMAVRVWLDGDNSVELYRLRIGQKPWWPK